MEWKRRDEEDMNDSLVEEVGKIVRFPLVPAATFAAPASRFLTEVKEVKQPHCRYTKRSNIMNYLVSPVAQDHLPLATLPCLPEQCNQCGKNFSRKSSLFKNMLVVNGASRPSKMLQERYLAKLRARRRISFVI